MGVHGRRYHSWIHAQGHAGHGPSRMPRLRGGSYALTEKIRASIRAPCVPGSWRSPQSNNFPARYREALVHVLMSLLFPVQGHGAKGDPVDDKMGRDAGALFAKARTDDPIDATVARSGGRILTSDPEDIDRLASRFDPPR